MTEEEKDRFRGDQWTPEQIEAVQRQHPRTMYVFGSMTTEKHNWLGESGVKHSWVEPPKES